MSKIYLRGRDPITTDEKTANRIRVDWIANPKSQDIVNVDGESFKLKDINSVSLGLDEGRYYGIKYNLDNDTDRQIIKDFEKEYLLWRETVGKDYSSLDSLDKFLETKKACLFKNGEKIITNPDRYTKLTAIFSALQILRIRRAKAEKIKVEDQEKIALTL